jgi:hypothetical protein
MVLFAELEVSVAEEEMGWDEEFIADGVYKGI